MSKRVVMDYSRIKEIIKDEISQWAVEELKNKETQKQASKPIEETPEESLIKRQKADKDAHDAVFYAFEDEKTIEQSKQRYLKESEEAETQILSSEISKFKQDMSANVSSNIHFDNQQNSHVIYAYRGDSGTEAMCSGSIPLNSENKIKWEFSLQNGAYVEANSELSEDFVELLTKLNSYYVSWKAEWSSKFA